MRAVFAGHLKCLQAAVAHGHELSEHALIWAFSVEPDHPLQFHAILDFVADQGCEWDDDFLVFGLEQADAYRCCWILDNLWRFPEAADAIRELDPCGCAAFFGLPMVMKARRLGFDWRDTLVNAASCGQLEVLKWARAQGCPWDDRAWGAAADQEETSQWIYLNGGGGDYGDPYVSRLVSGIVDRCLAATRIQQAWLAAYYNPRHAVCRRRLVRQLADLNFAFVSPV